MSIKRGSVLRGPAIIKLGNHIIRTAGDIQLSMGLDTFEIPSSEFGPIDQRRNNVMLSATFTPVGEVTADMLALYWPHLALPIGVSLFGATDIACDIVPVTGKEMLKFKAAAVTQMPNIIISATKTSLGEMTITGLLANEANWDAEAARYEYTPNGSAPNLGAIDVNNIATMPARVNWGDGFTDLKTGEGVTVAFAMETNDEECDEDGIFDVTLGNITASATLTPLNTTVGALLARMGLQGSNVLRGTSTAGFDLSVQASRQGGLKVTIPSARLANLPLAYGMQSRRIGELTLQGFRTSGAAATVGIVSAADISARSAVPVAPESGDEG